MKQMIGFSLAILAGCLANAASAQTTAQRQECERIYSPVSGQLGKDVVWVPTPDHLVTAMLKTGGVTAKDIVYDLGAGDGKIAIAAAKEFGVSKAVGIEYNEKFIPFADCLIKAAGVEGKAKVIHGDIFVTNFSEATVVTMYLLPELNRKLAPTLLKMKPGTRVVSHSFSMGDWAPDEKVVEKGADYIYLWIVPARAEGTWTLQSKGREPLVMRLEQKYSTLAGTVLDGGKLTTIEEGSLRGDELTIRYNGPSGPATLKGKVYINQITAALSSGDTTVAYTGSR
jgi:hypothetical protein